ncbi:MAG: hypothetical protein KJ718_06045 [Nanoarchaeota archaeon]|nr:hypothetical protein [Nanoarchaeota archaeon]MBU1052083.1 hypothetical protein [Nanoarchaeota archaeon]MBU1988156.1 hypothetical protein [Nanoarchaeota archaeon]
MQNINLWWASALRITSIKPNKMRGRKKGGTPTSPFNKKGLAEVVGTWALVVITVIAVFFAFNSVIKVMGTKADIQSSPEFNCLEVQTAPNPELKIEKTCYNTQTGDVEVTVKRSLKNSQINSLNFVFSDSTFSCSDSCGQGVCTILKQGTTKTYYISFETQEKPRAVTLFAGSCELDERGVVEC